MPIGHGNAPPNSVALPEGLVTWTLMKPGVRKLGTSVHEPIGMLSSLTPTRHSVMAFGTERDSETVVGALAVRVPVPEQIETLLPPTAHSPPTSRQRSPWLKPNASHAVQPVAQLLPGANAPR